MQGVRCVLICLVYCALFKHDDEDGTATFMAAGLTQFITKAQEHSEQPSAHETRPCNKLYRFYLYVFFLLRQVHGPLYRSCLGKGMQLESRQGGRRTALMSQQVWKLLSPSFPAGISASKVCGHLSALMRCCEHLGWCCVASQLKCSSGRLCCCQVLLTFALMYECSGMPFAVFGKGTCLVTAGL